MNINATIFGQLLTFSIFVWVNKKFIWPKILAVLNEREHKISEGLQAAELGKKQLQEAEIYAKQQELETRKYCNLLINEAKKQAEQILDLSIMQAKNKSDEIINNAYLLIEKERGKLQKDLQQNLTNLIMQSTEKILTINLNKELHQKILNDINSRIYEN